MQAKPCIKCERNTIEECWYWSQNGSQRVRRYAVQCTNCDYEYTPFDSCAGMATQHYNAHYERINKLFE